MRNCCDFATAQLGAYFVVQRGGKDGGGETGDEDDRAARRRARRGGGGRSGECRRCHYCCRESKVE
jgi:hypothetical protein